MVIVMYSVMRYCNYSVDRPDKGSRLRCADKGGPQVLRVVDERRVCVQLVLRVQRAGEQAVSKSSVSRHNLAIVYNYGKIDMAK